MHQMSQHTTQNVPLYGRPEYSVESTSNPHQSLGLAATFSSPSGVDHRVEGFWDGSTTWRARFSPGELGEWRLVLDSNGTT
jgi:hypothetical protein